MEATEQELFEVAGASREKEIKHMSLGGLGAELPRQQHRSPRMAQDGPGLRGIYGSIYGRGFCMVLGRYLPGWVC